MAGTNVLAVGLLGRGLWPLALGLGLAAALVWLALSYGLFCSIVLAGNRPLLREITGAWLVWVVGTQSLAIVAAYWILMGATAISVRTAAGILTLGDVAPSSLLTEMRPFVVGFSVVLWSFGTWFIPRLVLFGLWRYFVRGYSWGYEPKLWSVVFPLGMYTVASVTLGRAADFGFMTALADAWLWVGVAAWGAVHLLMIFALLRPASSRAPNPAPTRSP